MEYPVEPDVAREHVVNLLRRRVAFVVDQDPDVLKDVLVIGVGGALRERGDTHEYARELTCTSLDDACQFALNCIRDGFAYSVTPRGYPDGRTEWMFVAERRRDVRERRQSRSFG